MYMQWPLIMTILLLAMNIWMYMTDQKAGLTMTVFVIIYTIIAEHPSCIHMIGSFAFGI